MNIDLSCLLLLNVCLIWLAVDVQGPILGSMSAYVLQNFPLSSVYINMVLVSAVGLDTELIVIPRMSCLN